MTKEKEGVLTQSSGGIDPKFMPKLNSNPNSGVGIIPSCEGILGFSDIGANATHCVAETKKKYGV
jgi:hypothetical protein